MATQTNEQKVITALKNNGASMTAGEMAAVIGVAGSALATLVNGMIKSGAVVPDPADNKRIQLPASAKPAVAPKMAAVAAKPAVAVKAPAPAVAPKPALKKVAPAPVPEPVVEDEPSDEYTEDEITAFTEEYTELADKHEAGTITKAEQKRMDLIMPILEDAGVFGPVADDPTVEDDGQADLSDDDDEPETESEYTEEELDLFVNEYNELVAKPKPTKADLARIAEITPVLVDNKLMEDPDAETEDEPAEEEADFDFAEDVPTEDDDDTTDEHDADDNEENDVPASEPSDFTLPFKPIDQLSTPELTQMVEECTSVAESLHEQGYTWAAEGLMRSVAKANKQLAKRGKR